MYHIEDFEVARYDDRFWRHGNVLACLAILFWLLTSMELLQKLYYIASRRWRPHGPEGTTIHGCNWLSAADGGSSRQKPMHIVYRKSYVYPVCRVDDVREGQHDADTLSHGDAD